KIADGANSEYLLKIMVEPQESLFQKAININKPLILDKENMLSENLTVDFYEKFRLKNTLALPIFLSGRVVAMLGIGNTAESFLYRREDMELLDIFSKQIAIAIENDKLMQKVEKLEIKDTLTGLYNESFIRQRLEEEIKRSIVYHRPCAFILFDIDNFSKFQQQFGSRQTEAILKKIGSLIKDSLSDVDRAARSGDDQFAIILPEKNKRQAQKIAENIRKNIELTFTHETDMAKRITVSGGISENPLDGIDAEELITEANDLVALAKKQGRNRIVSFKEAESSES
ncbi:MAG: sensor domain-containing diguanylate cyclase, partial [Candidatus Omnitrophica bacterium]|nr:sensor domain-containing diguanylate cyclase [Candidatus Omnitrophota bacterium]